MKLSIRTKALIFLSVTLLLANAIWIYQNYQTLYDYFQYQQNEIHHQHNKILNNVFTRTQESLNLLSMSLLPLVLDKGGEDLANTLLLDQDVIYAKVTDKNNKLLFEVDLGLNKETRYTLKNLKDNKDKLALFCSNNQCYIVYSQSDYLPNGKQVKITLVKGIARELIDFYHATGSEIILFKVKTKTWILATHFQEIKPAYAPLSNQFSTLNKPSMIKSGDKHLLVDPLNPVNLILQEDIKFVAIKDITKQFNLFKNGIIEGIIIALVLWLLLQLTLSYFIIRSIKQLQRVNTAVRFLPKQDFDKAKAALNPNREGINDELDELENNTYEVSDQLESLTKKLVYMAHYDELTQLPNRNAFYQDFRSVLASQAPFSLCMANINNLKNINDLYGHEAGDRVIQSVANKLNERYTKNTEIDAKAYRLGADEFIVLIKECGQFGEFEHFLEEMAHYLTGEVLSLREEVVHYDTAVAGVLVSADEQDEKSVFYRLDLSMKKAKQGSNLAPWHLFDPARDDDSELVQRHLKLVDWMRDALNEDLFKLVFQPIVSLKDNKISHYEVLIRMFDPEGNFVSPAEFIPVAERYKLIRDIDIWVLDHAMGLLKTLPQKVKFAINLSAPSVQMLTLPELVEGFVEKHGIDPSRITLELTETAYVENLSQAQTNFNKIKAMGFKLALDDFGVGFTSFSHFSELPLDFVKIDGNYIKDLDVNKRHQTFTQGLVSIIHAFNMRAIAEFVENEAIVNLLKNFETDYGQGYHFSKPLSEDELKVKHL